MAEEQQQRSALEFLGSTDEQKSFFERRFITPPSEALFPEDVEERPDFDPRTELERALPGVDLDRGLAAATRAGIALRRGENLERFLDKRFGPGQWRTDELTGQLIIKDRQGQEFLADEFGFGIRDVADMVDLGIFAVGAFGGAVAAPVTAGAATLSAFVTAGELLAISLSDVLTTVGEVNAKRAAEIAEDRGPEAAVSFVLGFFGEKGARLISTRARDRTGLRDPTTTARAAEELEATTGIAIPLTPAQITQSPTLARIEAIGEKIPFASETFRKAALRQEEALRQIEGRMTSPDPSVPQRAVDELTRQYEAAELQVAANQLQVERSIQAAIDDIGDALKSGGRKLDLEAAGRVGKNAHMRDREQFRTSVRTLYREARRKIGPAKIVSAEGLRRAVRKEFRNIPRDKDKIVTSVDEAGAVQESVQKGGPSKVFMPPSISRWVDGLNDLDDMTLMQAIIARRHINNFIEDGEALPGFDTRILKRLSSAITQQIDAAKKSLPPEQANALTAAQEFYKTNFERFLQKDITPAFVTQSHPRHLEDSEFGRGFVFTATPERFRRTWSVLSPDEKPVVARAAWNDLVERSRPDFFAPGVVDVKKLDAELRRMPKEVRETLFGDQERTVVNTMRALAARQGYVDLSEIGDLTTGLAEQIRRAARLEIETQEQWKTGIFKRFIAGETEQMNPEGFIRLGLASGKVSLREIQEVKRRLGEDSALWNDIQRFAAKYVISNSSRAATADDVLIGLVGGGDEIIDGVRLFENVTKPNLFGDNSSAKMKELLGEDTVNILKNIAIVRAGQQQKKDVSAAGGLIAGALISSLMRGNLSQAPLLVQYKVMSVIMTNPLTLRLLRTGKRLESTLGRRGSQTAAMIGALSNDIATEFSEDTDGRLIAMNIIGETFNIPELHTTKPSAAEFLSREAAQ